MEVNIFKRVFHYFEKHTYIPVIILFLLAEFLINPIGEFCLNDDWAYAKAVNTFVKTSELKFSFWQAIPGIPLIFTGIFFSKLFGFSFTLLRFISIACVLISTILLDVNLKRLAVSTTNRLLVLVLFVFNPLTISLGNSFMPDVFQLMLGMFTFHFMILYSRNRKGYQLILFIVCSLLLSLNRQTGIIIPLLFFTIVMIREKRNTKNIGLGIMPFLITALGLFIFEYSAKTILPQNYNLQLNNILATLLYPNLNSLKTIGYYFITSTICLGLFSLPLTISSIKQNYELLKKSLFSKLILTMYLALIIVKLLYSGNIFPFVGNMFYHLGIGPVILTGFNTDENHSLSIAATYIWTILNFVGGLSFFISLQLILKKLWEEKQTEATSVKLFFSIIFILYLLPLCFSYANDRYLLFLIPFYVMALIVSMRSEITKFSFLLFFAPLFYFSIAGTHDYLALNKARMQATDYLVRGKSISPKNIDGGFEFNGWYAEDTRNYIATHKDRWWFVEKDDYIISPVGKAGYSVEQAFGFSSWMSFGFNEIFVLKKLE
jgi:hypothetical protein